MTCCTSVRRVAEIWVYLRHLLQVEEVSVRADWLFHCCMSLHNDKLSIHSSSLHFLTSLYMASVSLSTTNSVVFASDCLIFPTTLS